MSTTNSSASGGTQPLNVPLEYTRGTGAFYPTATSIASNAGLTQAVQSVNGATTSSVTIAPGTSSTGVSVAVASSKTGKIQVGVSLSAQATAVGVGTSYPSNPVLGQQFLNTTVGGSVKTWNGTAWQ